MKRSARLTFLTRTLQAGTLAVAVCFSLGATDAGSRVNDLGHRMMCTCSCAQMLGECNHVSCPSSGPMRNELSDLIVGGKSDQEILSWFANKYGPTVLAAPTGHGFDLVAWIAPFAVFAAASLGTVLLVRRWSVGRTQIAVADSSTIDVAERERRDQVRRETGDGGF